MFFCSFLWWWFPQSFINTDKTKKMKREHIVFLVALENAKDVESIFFSKAIDSFSKEFLYNFWGKAKRSYRILRELVRRRRPRNRLPTSCVASAVLMAAYPAWESLRSGTYRTCSFRHVHHFCNYSYSRTQLWNNMFIGGYIKTDKELVGDENLDSDTL